MGKLEQPGAPGISNVLMDAQEWIRAAVSRYERPLTLYASRFTGDLETARDVVQETFLKLCSEEREVVESHLAEWLFSVCRHHALDIRRKESRMMPLSEARVEKRQSSQPAPAELAEKSEAMSLMIRMLDALPERQQEVLRLKFQHGLSYKEISRVMDITVTNVGFLIHTGLKTIRQRMNESARAEA